jgi:hypothetical protein
MPFGPGRTLRTGPDDFDYTSNFSGAKNNPEQAAQLLCSWTATQERRSCSALPKPRKQREKDPSRYYENDLFRLLSIRVYSRLSLAFFSVHL